MLAAMCRMDLFKVVWTSWTVFFFGHFQIHLVVNVLGKIAHISLFISLRLFVIMSPVGETICQRIDFL